MPTARHARPRPIVRSLLVAGCVALLACGLPAPALAAATPIVTAPAPGSFVADPSLHVSFSEADPLGTTTFDVWVAGPDCSTAGPPARTLPADPLQTDYGADVTLDGADGPRCVTVVAHDLLGVDPAGASTTVTLDTTAPNPPGSPDATNPDDQFPQLEWGPGTGDRGGSGVAAYALYRDGVVIHTEPVGDGSRRTFVDTGAGAGTTGYAITVSDELGHESAPVTLDALYDGPSTTILDHPADPARTSQATFSFGASEPGTFRCSLDAGAEADCPNPDTVTGLADGDHALHVHAVDQNGTAGADQTFRWTVDTAAARFTLDGPSGLIDHGDVTYVFSSDDPGSTFTCQLDVDATEPCTSPKSYTLADGPHHVTVTETDTAGNVQSDSRDVTVDTVAPTEALDAGPPPNDTSDSATFAWHASEPGVTFECRLDGGALDACDGAQTVTRLSDGPHEFQVRGTDPAGNVGPFLTYDWTVDADAPDTTIDSGPTGLTNATEASFGFHSNDASATFECALDGGAFAACTSPDTRTALADGPHTFEVRARDAAGNVDATPAERTFTVDTQAPETTVSSGPASPTNDRTPAYAFGSDDPAASFQCSVDGAAFSACSSGATLGPLADGPHSFAVRARDAAGNVDPTPDQRTLVIDTTAPTADITSGPAAHATSATATFEFAADESADFECRLDGGAFADCSSPWTFSVNDGDHTFEARAVDAAGNVGPADSWSWSVDVNAPSTTITDGPGALTDDSTPSFSFSSNDSSASFLCSLDGQAYAACTSPKQVGPLADGPHSFAVEARDGSGNTDPTPDQRSFVVDTTPPTTQISGGPSGPTSDDRPSFTFSSPSADATAFECSIDLPATFSTCHSGDHFGPLPEGPHTFYVRARDDAGNVDPSPPQRAFAVDTEAPVTLIDSKPPDASADPSATFTFHASDGVSYECRLDAGAIAACTSPKTYPGLADGPHTFAVRATDAAGNVGAFVSDGWTIDATAPDTTIDSGPSGLTADSTPAFTFHSNDPGASFECAADTGAWAACTSPHSLASLADGPHAFHVRARDASGNVDAGPAERSFTVDTLPPDTTIESGPDAPMKQATFAFDSPDATATFQCAIDAQAFAACSSPYVTPGSVADGAHTFSVRARDQVGNVDPTPESRSFSLDNEAPNVTLLTKPANPTNQTTATFTFQADESDATYACQLDAGALAACASGVSYPGLAPGNHSFKVRATDAAGNVGPFATHAWTIDLSAPQLDITAGPPPAIHDLSATFSFTSPAPGASYLCKLDRPGHAGTYVACFNAKTYNDLVEAAYSFSVKATTPAGNSSTASRAFTVDRTGPSGTFPALPALSHGLVQFAAKPTDLGAPPTGVASVTYAYKPAGSTVWTTIGASNRAPWTIGWDTSGLPDGVYSVRAAPTDAAGNTSINTIPTVTTTLDNTGPTASVATASQIVRGTVTVTATVQDPAKVVHVTFTARDAAGAVSTLADQSGSDLHSVPIAWFTGGPVLDGSYVLQVVARDTLGNERSSPPVTVIVDNTVPGPPVALTASATPTRAAPMIAWPANTSIDVAGYDVYRGGQRVATQIAGTSFADALATNGTQDGIYPYTVTAVDRAGNESPPSPPVTVVFDTTPPGAPATLTSGGQNGTVTLTWPAAADPSAGNVASGIAGYVLRRATGPLPPASIASGEAVCTVATAVTSCTDAGRAIGVQLAYTVFAVDAAGNVSAGTATSVTPRAVVPLAPDHTPTAKASKLRATVKASRATVTWVNPKDADFDHVQVVVNTKRVPKTPADGKRVYRGASTRVSFIGAAGTRTHVAIFAYDHTGNVTTAATVLVKFAPALLQPLTGTVVDGSPKLSWKGVKGAAYYNVQLFQKVGRKRIAIAWPHGTSYRVAASKLKKGKTYVWYVWPGYGKLKDARYGKLIGSSTFVYR